MRSKATRHLLSISAAVVLLAARLSAAGGATDPTLSISPNQGTVLAAGFTIHVSGSGCPDSAWDDSLEWHVHVQTLQGDSAGAALTITPPSGTPSTPLAFPAIGYPGVATADTTPAADGSWAVDLVIPGSGTLAANPGSVYPVTATCYAAEGVEAGTIGYASQGFTAFAKGGPPPITTVTPPIIAAPTFSG
jgi:hypothetical protein